MNCMVSSNDASPANGEGVDVALGVDGLAIAEEWRSSVGEGGVGELLRLVEEVVVFSFV